MGLRCKQLLVWLFFYASQYQSWQFSSRKNYQLLRMSPDGRIFPPVKYLQSTRAGANQIKRANSQERETNEVCMTSTLNFRSKAEPEPEQTRAIWQLWGQRCLDYVWLTREKGLQTSSEAFSSQNIFILLFSHIFSLESHLLFARSPYRQTDSNVCLGQW